MIIWAQDLELGLLIALTFGLCVLTSGLIRLVGTAIDWLERRHDRRH